MSKLPRITTSQALELNGHDLAFRYSIENDDIENMRMVLRAYGFDFSIDAAFDIMSDIDAIDAAKG
jgi:hypothetical protein